MAKELAALPQFLFQCRQDKLGGIMPPPWLCHSSFSSVGKTETSVLPPSTRFATVPFPVSARLTVHHLTRNDSFATVPFPVSARRVDGAVDVFVCFATVPFPVSARPMLAALISNYALPQFLFQCRQDATSISSTPFALCHSSFSSVGKTPRGREASHPGFATVPFPVSARRVGGASEEQQRFATVPFPVSARPQRLRSRRVSGFATVPFPVSARRRDREFVCGRCFATVPFPVSARPARRPLFWPEGFATVPFPVSARHPRARPRS